MLSLIKSNLFISSDPLDKHKNPGYCRDLKIQETIFFK